MILITAAGGNVGQHVVTQLADKQIAARAGFHTQSKASALRAPGIEGIVLEFENPASLKSALRGVTKMFLVSPGSPDQGKHERALIAEAKRAGVKHIVKLSGKIAENNNVGFARWNQEAEHNIKESGIPATILRANFFMQNLLGSAEQIKKGAFTMGPAGKRIAHLDTRDIAATAVSALTEDVHAGETYDINGPELLDGPALAATFSRLLGRPIKYLDVSIVDLTDQLKSHGMPVWLVEAMAAALAAPIPGDQSSATMERLLKRKPIEFEQFVNDYRVAFQS